MAEAPDPKSIKTAEEIEKEITCAICHGHYRDPKILPCLHYFCADCLQRLTARVGQPVTCPECHREATFDDVRALLTPFFVNRMIGLHERVEKAEGRAEALCELCKSMGKAEAFCRQCERFVCDDCVNTHDKLASTMLRGHVLVALEQLKVGGARDVVASPRKCPEHDEPLKVFCFKCNRLICHYCIVDGHLDHEREFVIKAAPECRDKLRASLAHLQKGHAKISSTVETITKREREITENQSSVEDAITQSIDELIERKRQMLHEASILTMERLSAVRAQQKDLALSLVEAQSMAEFVEQSLERATDEEVMEMQQQIVNRVEEYYKKLQQMDFEPAAESNVRVAMPTSGTPDLCFVGQVYIEPSKCSVETKGVEEGEVNKPAEFSLQLADNCGRAVEGPYVVEVGVRSLVDGSVSQATVTPAENGIRKITYTPRNRGRHSISVKLNRREVAGSPFAMFARLPPSQLENPIKLFSEIQNPYGITISKSGDVIAAERCVGREVVVFSKQGERVKAIKHASVNHPCGVATDPDGHIYVSSSFPQTVFKFSQDGLSLLEQTRITGKSQYLGMMQVIDGQLFVCSSNDHVVIVLDCRNLQEIRRFGHEGSGNGEFNWTMDVVAEKGELYVSDYTNHRIQVFNMEGGFIRLFTVMDPTTQKCYAPRGICVGPDRLLYVACYKPDHRILAFTLAGECVASVAVGGDPAGIVADTDGFLYVCMEQINAIEVF